MGFFKNILSTVKNNLRVNEPDAWAIDAEKGYQAFFEESEKYMSKQNIPPRYYDGQLLQGQNPVFKEKHIEKTETFPDNSYISDEPSAEEKRKQADADFIKRQEEEDKDCNKRKKEIDDAILFNIFVNPENIDW